MSIPRQEQWTCSKRFFEIGNQCYKTFLGILYATSGITGIKTYGNSLKICSKIYTLNTLHGSLHAMDSSAYLVMDVSYTCKMFTKWTTGVNVLHLLWLYIIHSSLYVKEKKLFFSPGNGVTGKFSRIIISRGQCYKAFLSIIC